jgi:hypothetical protein
MPNSGRTQVISGLMGVIGGLAIGLAPTGSASAELPAKPHDCFYQALADEDLKSFPIGELNEYLEERGRRPGNNATIAQWTRMLRDANNYVCMQHPESRIGPAGLEKRFVARAIGSELSDDAKKGLRGTCLRKADLRGLDLSHADLAGANLYKADLTGTDLHFANLEGAILECANLTDADLSGANLRRAMLKRTLLKIADLDEDLDLTGALVEPREVAPPENLVHIKGLDSIHFDDDKTGLENLRKALSAGGMDYQDRQVRYSIITSELSKAGCVERIFSYALFGITSGWGLYPWRPIGILVLCVIPAFFFVYLVLIRAGCGTINRKWPRNVPPTQDDVRSLRKIDRLITVFYFSVLSSLHIKLSDFDPGILISRMQPNDYTLQATLWLRLASGLQSLLSFYLLALWVVAYVGPEVKRMFE